MKTEEREREIVYSEERKRPIRVHMVSTRYAVFGRLIGAFRAYTHARVYIPSSKKRPLSPLPPRHVHSRDMGYHRDRSSDPQGVPGDTKYVMVYTIYKDVKIFYEALAIRSLTSKSYKPLMVLYTVHTYI